MASAPPGHAAGTPPVERLFRTVLHPVAAFFRLEAASGLVLLACAAAAVAWANLDHRSYQEVLGATVALRLGERTVAFTLHALVNDGLMALFFFLVGMEIKHELALGELRTLPQAALPVVAALGGMVVPAALYLAWNAGGPGAPGWGIPMATDIAFCIGVLTLLGGRVPHPLVVFVTALAIFDDIGGILVIAFFYGTGIQLPWLLCAAGVAAAAFAMGRAHVRSALAWAVAGVLLWLALHHSGVHATIAGVVLGLAIPARPRRPARQVVRELSAYAATLREGPGQDEDRDQAILEGIGERLTELAAPLDRFVEALHPWVAFGIMPLFALCNSGVYLAGLERSQLAGPVAVGTALALLLGKPVGIFAFTLGAVRLGLARLPAGSSLLRLLGVAVVAGIGFTVALFIAGLAFPGDARLLDEAKVGILGGSLLAGLLGAILLLLAPGTRGTDDGPDRERDT